MKFMSMMHYVVQNGKRGEPYREFVTGKNMNGGYH